MRLRAERGTGKIQPDELRQTHIHAARERWRHGIDTRDELCHHEQCPPPSIERIRRAQNARLGIQRDLRHSTPSSHPPGVAAQRRNISVSPAIIAKSAPPRAYETCNEPRALAPPAMSKAVAVVPAVRPLPGIPPQRTAPGIAVQRESRYPDSMSVLLIANQYQKNRGLSGRVAPVKCRIDFAKSTALIAK